MLVRLALRIKDACDDAAAVLLRMVVPNDPIEIVDENEPIRFARPRSLPDTVCDRPTDQVEVALELIVEPQGSVKASSLNSIADNPVSVEVGRMRETVRHAPSLGL